MPVWAGVAYKTTSPYVGMWHVEYLRVISRLETSHPVPMQKRFESKHGAIHLTVAT